MRKGRRKNVPRRQPENKVHVDLLELIISQTEGGGGRRGEGFSEDWLAELHCWDIMSWKWRQRGATEPSEAVRLTQPAFNFKRKPRKAVFYNLAIYASSFQCVKQVLDLILNLKLLKQQKLLHVQILLSGPGVKTQVAEFFISDCRGSPTIRSNKACGYPQHLIQRAGSSAQSKPFTSLLASEPPDSCHALKRRESSFWGEHTRIRRQKRR